MSNIEHALPVGIGETVLVPARKLAGPVAMVVVWRFVRPRFLVGGVLDRPSQLSVQVLLEQWDEHRLSEGEVTALGTPARASCFLPFTDGDLVSRKPRVERSCTS